MPKFPRYAERMTQIGASVFEKFRTKMIAKGDDLVKLHVGDSAARPPYDLPLDPSFVKDHPSFNRYCDTFGIPALREVLVDKVREDNGLDAAVDNVLVTCGATNALAVSMQTLVEPGDEVMLLSPFWPFFRGMIHMAGGVPVEVPFYTALYDNPDADIDAMLETAVTEKTAVLYLNSPNNPSGKVLSKTQLETVCAFAKRHELWLVSDEAYDGMVFDEHVHHSPASFDGMAERTLSVFTFSKVFMFSGARVGYVVGNEEVIRVLNKAFVHQLYSVSTVVQEMLVEPVKTRASWRAEFVGLSQELRDVCLKHLGANVAKPDGAYYLFFPVTEYLRGRDYWSVIDECLEAGVSVAPGQDFGEGFSHYIRICFAGEPRDRLELGMERLNAVLGQENP
jgi:N-succinyldiaminopimelate aminotransferase